LGKRINISSGGKYEKIVGYSRAVAAGNMVFVSGTTGVANPEAMAGSNSNNKNTTNSAEDAVNNNNNSYHQAVRAIKNIESALKEAGCSLEDVVRTRVFLRRDADWKDVARAHSEFFGGVLPASSMLVVDFLDPKILVEIEADAVKNRY
jgi:enamine deaminase RidA (YjgF/YER057c/UK114 family)